MEDVLGIFVMLLFVGFIVYMKSDKVKAKVDSAVGGVINKVSKKLK